MTINPAYRPGTKAEHVDFGPVTIIKVRKDGAVVVRDENGIEGTCHARSLRVAQ